MEGQDPKRSTGESRAWQLCRQHPYSCTVFAKTLDRGSAPKQC